MWLTYHAVYGKILVGVIYTVVKDLKKHFDNYHLCECAIAFYRERITKYKDKLSYRYLGFEHDYYDFRISLTTEQIRRTEEYKAKVLSLFDYCENDFDRELLQRRYIARQSYYEISCDICYTERTTFKLYEKAFQRLAEKTKALPNIKF
jgi:hypothetical protein